MRVLLQAASQEIQNLPRGRLRQQRPVRLALENGGQRVAHCLGWKGHPSGQALVKYTTERPDVCTLVKWLASRLLWAHVSGRAQKDCSTGASFGQHRSPWNSAKLVT